MEFVIILFRIVLILLLTLIIVRLHFNVAIVINASESTAIFYENGSLEKYLLKVIFFLEFITTKKIRIAFVGKDNQKEGFVRRKDISSVIKSVSSDKIISGTTFENNVSNTIKEYKRIGYNIVLLLDDSKNKIKINWTLK